MSLPASLSELAIPLKGLELNGELTVPEAAQGVVAFAHGSGSSRHSPRNQFVARSLRDRGVGTLLFDLLTAQEEEQDRHTGHLRFDINLLAERLHGAAQWLHRAHPDLTIGYFGSSTGAAAALVAAARADLPISAVVSRGGRPDLAGPALPEVKAPTLLIVGANDTAVVEMNRAAFVRLQCPKDLKLIAAATHLFEEPGTLEQVARLAADWFAQHLRRPH